MTRCWVGTNTWKWFAQLRIRQLVGKRASGNIHCGSPDYEAVQSKGVISLTLGSNARRRVHQNKKYKTLGSLALATALMASLLPTMALSQDAPPSSRPANRNDQYLEMTEAQNELRLMLASFRNDMTKRGRGYSKVSIRKLPGSHGGYSLSFQLPKGAAFYAMVAAMTTLTKLGLQVKVHSAVESTLHPAISFVVDHPPTGENNVKGNSSSVVLGDMSVTFFSDKLSKHGLSVVAACYKAAHTIVDSRASAFQQSPQLQQGSHDSMRDQDGSSCKRGAIAKLESMGLRVFDEGDNTSLNDEQNGRLDWDSLAGYEDVKRKIVDTLILPLKHPDEYDRISQATRARFEMNRPRAILLEGPPGTGKTLTARIVAGKCNLPMVLVNIEHVVSKWYGDSEKRLAEIWNACENMGGAVIFLDEVDALGNSRDKQPHEASRRILSVLLQKIDGFEGSSKSTLICATNRMQDLDAALLSRYDLTIRYHLPNLKDREAIIVRYAKHLDSTDIQQLAAVSHGLRMDAGIPSDCGLVKLSEMRALVERCQMWVHIRLASLDYPTYRGTLNQFRARLARRDEAYSEHVFSAFYAGEKLLGLGNINS